MRGDVKNRDLILEKRSNIVTTGAHKDNLENTFLSKSRWQDLLLAIAEYCQKLRRQISSSLQNYNPNRHIFPKAFNYLLADDSLVISSVTELTK